MIEALFMSIATILVSVGFTFLLIRHFYGRPPAWVSDLFIPIDDKGTTKLDTWIGRAVDSLFARFQFSAMGAKSGEARLEKGLQSAMLDDVINSQSPLLGIVMEQFPQVKGYLMKHPQALPQIIGMLGPLLQGKGLLNFQNSGPSRGSNNPFKVE